MGLDEAVWAMGILLLFLAVSCLVVYLTARGHEKSLARSRAGYDVECFVQEMVELGQDATAARLAYLYIQEMHGIGFPILPGDDLFKVLGVNDEALQRAITALLHVCGRAPRRGYLMRPLTTTADLVVFVSNAPMAREQMWHLQTVEG